MIRISNAEGAVLVTGGAGYIGSHTCVELMQAGMDVIIFDNLSNAKYCIISRIEGITGRKPKFVEGDIRESVSLDKVFAANRISAVLHFAALKSPLESISRPIEYYDNNVAGSLSLVNIMKRNEVHTLAFSSSAAVYGNSATSPIKEDASPQAIHPYGGSKIIVENILQDIFVADKKLRAAVLRYFNPVGTHESGLIGEDRSETPNNIVPFISQVAAGHRDYLSIFGSEYPTPDRAGVRDYIHVFDVAKGHLAALEYIVEKRTGIVTANPGLAGDAVCCKFSGHSKRPPGRRYRTVLLETGKGILQ